MSFIFVDIAETSCDELERPLCEFNVFFFLKHCERGRSLYIHNHCICINKIDKLYNIVE